MQLLFYSILGWGGIRGLLSRTCDRGAQELSPLCQPLFPSSNPTSCLFSLRGALDCHDPTLSAAQPPGRLTQLHFAAASPMLGIRTGDVSLFLALSDTICNQPSG